MPTQVAIRLASRHDGAEFRGRCRVANKALKRSAWGAQVTELTDAVQRWSGNACEILEYAEDEFASLVRAGDTLVEKLGTDAVGLIGKPPRELTRARR